MRTSVGAEPLIRQPREPKESLRDYPTYSVHEAALFIAMPQRTLQRWVYDKPFFEVAGSEYRQNLLSFKDLAQYYFLHFVRNHAGLSDRQARDLLSYAKLVTGSAYPLLHGDIKILFRHILLDRPAQGERRRIVLDLHRPRGQYVFQEVVDLFATRVSRDARGLMRTIYPWRFWKEGDMRRPVEIDPHVMSGRLVVTGTRIPVMTVAARRKAGESVRDIAKDYCLTQEIVKQSLRHLGLHKAA